MLRRLATVSMVLILFSRAWAEAEERETTYTAMRRSSPHNTRLPTIARFVTFYLEAGAEMLFFAWLIFLHSSRSGSLVSRAQRTVTTLLKSRRPSTSGQS